MVRFGITLVCIVVRLPNIEHTLDFPLCEWRVFFATVYWVVKQRYCFLSPLPPLKATKTEKGGGLHILPQFSEISVPLFSDIEKNNCFAIIYARSDLYNSRSKHLQNPFKVNLNDVSKRRPFWFCLDHALLTPRGVVLNYAPINTKFNIPSLSGKPRAFELWRFHPPPLGPKWCTHCPS